MMLAGLVGIAIGFAENWLPERWRGWLPSPVAVGLALVLPASISIVMCFGAVLAAVAAHLVPAQARRFTVTVAAGLVAGESIAGVAAALLSMTG